MIRYLHQTEKINSRSLWEEIFLEDSVDFLDYYYKYKTIDNLILVKEKDKMLISMLHLNPYRVSVLGELYNSYYIVAVATKAANRHQGHMRELLTYALNDMYQRTIPFTFLMPASEAIYIPFDFTYIYHQEKRELIRSENLFQTPITTDEYKRVANFINYELEKKYDVFSMRTKEYIRNLHKECFSEHGDIKVLYDRDGIAGCSCYLGEDKTEQRELICKDQYYKKVGQSKPAIMARIVNMPIFMEAFRLKGSKLDKLDSIGEMRKRKLAVASLGKKFQKKVVLHLQVIDNLIDSNNGLFHWSIDNQGSLFKPCDIEYHLVTSEEKITIGIKALTSWLFGYQTLEELWKNNEIICKNDLLEKLRQIRILKGVFLDEIV